MTRAHWLRPIKGEVGRSRHLLLWQEEDRRGDGRAARARRLTPGRRRMWIVDMRGPKLATSVVSGWEDAAALADRIAGAHPNKGTLTVWTARGWSDLVLTGLAELIDAGIYTWRYANIDGARCLFRGALSGLSTVITSLPCWTGGRWDAWPQCAESDPGRDCVQQARAALLDSSAPLEGDEALALATLVTILSSAWLLGAGNPQPTVASQARRLWQSWLGPRVWREETVAAKKGQKASVKTVCYVGPIPTRPDAAAAAERHVCYGLPREQFASGRYDGQVYVADMANAYLASYLGAPMPLLYADGLRRPSPAALADALCGHTGLALCLLDTDGYPYPVRRARKPGRAVGRYWTWLCGTELAQALCHEYVREVESAWLWHADLVPGEKAGRALLLSAALETDGVHGVKSCWRALYSAIIGSYAGWARVWEDCTYPHSFGRWSVWSGMDPTTGEEVRYRSIAGRVQRLTGRADAAGSVPLLFGCVTAALRVGMMYGVSTAGPGQVLSLSADALWLTTAGWQALQRALSADGVSPDSLRVKAIYDRVWMTGSGRAVVEREGRRYAVLSGVPHDLAADADGVVRWRAHEDWPSQERPTAARGVQSRAVHFNTARLIKEYDYPYRAQCPWLQWQDGLLPEELLTPRRPTRRVDDE